MPGNSHRNETRLYSICRKQELRFSPVSLTDGENTKPPGIPGGFVLSGREKTVIIEIPGVPYICAVVIPEAQLVHILD
jgi:hypothetical protein